MALTAREQTVLYLTIAVILLLVADSAVLGPIMARRDQAAVTRQDLETQLEKSLTTLKRKKRLQQRWKEMQQAGLDEDVQKAEATVYRYLEDVSSKSDLELGSVQPDRLATEGDIGEIDFVVSGTGSMQSVTEFLWEIETTDIPLKIKSCQLGSKNEMAAVMTLQLKVSTIYVKRSYEQEKEL